ncbi:MAG: DUF4031 domain-containing protein [Demequina sp.]
MSVLVDPPLWPRHGRVWGHLVSDSSLDELHAIARKAEIPARGFDLDHYDVPAEMYEVLVSCGVELVDSRTLVRRLRASGLRVTSAQRRAHPPTSTG